MIDPRRLAMLQSIMPTSNILRLLTLGGGPAATAPTAPTAPMAPQPASPSPTRSAGPGGRTLVVGDSLGVGTVPYLKGAGGKVTADVRVGRSSQNGVNAMRRLLQSGNFNRVVMDLGTNDADAAQLRRSVLQAMRLSGGRDIYVPTVRGPQAAAKNAVLRRITSSAPNVHLVDWAGQSQGLVGPDGIHATGSGYRRRAQILARAMR